MSRAIALVLALTGSLSSGARAREPTIVAVAASVREVARDAAAALEVRFGPRAFAVHAGGSAVLARQIERGAPAAVLVSAAPDEIEALDRAGRVVPGSRRTLAANRLVMIAPVGAVPPATIADLADGRFRRIALANPRTAPAGRYARAALERAGVLDVVEPRAVFGESVRQVLEYVARGDADAGLVYASDVARQPAGVVVSPGRIPEAGPPILVVGARIRGDGEDPRAIALLDWLGSPDGRAAFARAGFLAPPAARGDDAP